MARPNSIGRSKTIAAETIPAARARISAWIRWSGALSNCAQASPSRSKTFPETTKCAVFGLRRPPVARIAIVINDPAQDSTEATQHACGFRRKIEQLHGEGKQVTGLERCQCRKARIQRNHIACAFLVWGRLKELATEIGRTIYQLKHGLLSDYLMQQLKRPSLKMASA